MKHVALQELRLEHFKSFVQPTNIVLPIDAGLTLIAGDNRIEPRLGANGAGKSTAFDALCFALYGTSVRGVRISDLITKGEKQLSVTALLEIDGEAVAISRTGPPSHVFIEGKQVEQEDVERLVGLSRVRFLNSVVFGQAAPLFIDLPIPQRGELLDELLDLQLYLRAADRAGKRAASAQAELGKLRVEIGRTEGAISALEDADQLQEQINAWDSAYRERQENLLAVLEVSEGDLARLREELAVLPTASSAATEAISQEVRTAQRVESEIRSKVAVVVADIGRVKGDLQFFEETAECPSCGQKISKNLAEAHRKLHLEELEAKQTDHQGLIQESLAAQRRVDELQASYRTARVAENEATSERARIRAQLEAKGREVRTLEMQGEQLLAEVNPHAERLERLAEQRLLLEAGLAAHRASEVQQVSDLAKLDFWRAAFRRVRLFCVGRVLQELEIETMNAAGALGLVGWHITYATETETRSGTAKMGVQIEVASPTMAGPFTAWSGGEGQRVRLCVALGLAGLIQRWSGVRWGLEIFDEPTAFLSSEGIENLLDLLKDRADASMKSILIADHRALTHSGFSRVITVVKDEHGSRIQ